MSFIRSSLLVLISALLLISFLITGIFATLNYSLKYENVKTNIQPMLKSFLPEEATNQTNILIDEYYYKKYDCKFFKCFNGEKIPLFVISKHAKDFWKKQFYIFLGISILLVVLTFLLMENKNNFPFLIGGLLISGFLPIIALVGIAKFALSSLGAPLSFDLSSIASIFFSKANSVFLTGLIIGIILIAIGILLKLLKIGIEVEEWIEEKNDEKR